MFTAFGKPSRLKDILGTVFLVGTAMLYAFETSHAVAEPCEAPVVAPAAPPEDSGAVVGSSDRDPSPSCDSRWT